MSQILESSKFETLNLKQIPNTNDRNSKPSIEISKIRFLVIGIYFGFRHSNFGFPQFVNFKVNCEHPYRVMEGNRGSEDSSTLVIFCTKV